MEEPHSHLTLGDHTKPESYAKVEEVVKVEVKEEIETETEDFYKYDYLNVALEEDNVIEPNSLFCDQSGFLAGPPSTLKSHINYEHKERKYKCEHCDYAAPTLSILNNHVGNKHLGIKVQCEDCDYMAGSKGNLKVHRLSMHTNIKFNCTFCDFETSHQANLKKHIKGKHTSDEEKQKLLKRCSLCDFTTLWSLNKHMRYVHKHDHKHKSDMMKCQWQGCAYETHQNSFLEEHVQSCHEGYMHKCDDCDFKSEKIKKLKLHIYMKHEQNKHICDQCSATFKFKSRLERHIESVHLDINYPCDLCDHIASCKDYFNTHMKQNHGEKFRCGLCEYVSNRKSLLRTHIKAKHGSDLEQQQLIQLAYQSTDAKELQQTKPQQVSHQFKQSETHFNLTNNSNPFASTLSDQNQLDSIALPKPASKISEQFDAKDLWQTAEHQEFYLHSEQETAPLNRTLSHSTPSHHSSENQPSPV